MVRNPERTVGASPEAVVEYAWADAGVQTAPIARTMFTVAALGDATRWKVARKGVQSLDPSLRLKYEGEYTLTQARCSPILTNELCQTLCSACARDSPTAAPRFAMRLLKAAPRNASERRAAERSRFGGVVDVRLSQALRVKALRARRAPAPHDPTLLCADQQPILPFGAGRRVAHLLHQDSVLCFSRRQRQNHPRHPASSAAFCLAGDMAPIAAPAAGSTNSITVGVKQTSDRTGTDYRVP